ncbi:MAG: hypothetical protein HDKAJFGB_00172 [Anaerolineae bacterium]|nr:hypothetical protein [Anaerolineae bacterium]
MSAKNETPKKQTKTNMWSAEEKAAMRERAQELKAEERMNKNRAAGESAALAVIAGMPEPDRGLAQRIYELVNASAPALLPKTWYGMPAFANKEGKIICFFQAASKFNTRYATFGFQPDAKLDKGNMWAASFAVIKLTAAEEAKITALVKKAARGL